jgi:ABC transport system ATP-binding/permease protein
LLDEPTNDLDIETLTALEDLLDSWPGTLVIVSHDRYFVERVCDDVFALTGHGAIRHMPGGIEQYVQSRRVAVAAPAAAPRAAAAATAAAATLGGGATRAARKEIQRLERTLDRLATRESELHAAMAASATDHGRLRELQSELTACVAEREHVEGAWLEVAEALEA